MVYESSKRRILLATTVLCLAVLMLAGCKRQVVHNVMDAYVPKSSTHQLSMEQIEHAIIEAGAGRGWVMSTQEPGLIIGTLNIRAHQAVVKITYDQNSYNITYLNSTNLKYDGEKIHRNYNNWINYLERDINVRLAAELSSSK
ncbi:hypothetical protein [Paucidesulfovibrio longus]|uniref:hypothetical protein n=1 Tax=Paucidesulfovibrio longus TaxID=889 RepID=UPI0003B43219|nr:hypothetical protein [Paucidesulfovibrio longus]